MLHWSVENKEKKKLKNIGNLRIRIYFLNLNRKSKKNENNLCDFVDFNPCLFNSNDKFISDRFIGLRGGNSNFQLINK